MDALILAAGRGSRLGTSAPKCLAEVGGRSVLDHQLAAFRRAGIENITIVVGYGHEQIRCAAPEGVRFIYNQRFAETNSMYSFHLAHSVIHTDVVVLNSDVLFPFEILTRVLRTGGSALAFDSGSGRDAEHMKVRLRGDRVAFMSKQLSPAGTHGENVGLLQLSGAAAQAAFAAAGALVRRGHQRAWLAQAVSAIAASHRIRGVDIAGLPWIEIDYPEDLAAARDCVWPAIAALEQRVPPASLSAGYDDEQAAVAG